MKIAVTGASGFIGTDILELLSVSSDAEIIALTRSAHDGEAEERICWTVTDYSVEQLTEQLTGVDAIIHLAAVRGTTGGIADYQVNETLTENILLAMAEAGVGRIVFASSIAVYSDVEQIPWTERMPLSPKTLYGVTKAACEHLCEFYSRKFGYAYSIVRIAQVLGTGERRRTMTNVFMESASKGAQLRVMGKSRAKRQYIYSRDLAGILCAFAQWESGENHIVNAGMKEACTNLEIAKMTNRVFASETPIDYDDSFEETIEPSCMDISELTALLHMEPCAMTEALENIKQRDFQS